MPTETCLESNERQTADRSERSENAIDEACSGKGYLIGQQKELAETLTDKTEVKEYGDLTKIVSLPDGLQTLRINPDKSVTTETKHKDGSVTSTTVPEGEADAATRNGSQAVVDSNGKVIVVDKDGNRSEFHPGRILRRFDPAAKELP